MTPDKGQPSSAAVNAKSSPIKTPPITRNETNQTALAAYMADIRAEEERVFEQCCGLPRAIGTSFWSGSLSLLKEIDERHGIQHGTDPRVYSITAFKVEEQQLEEAWQKLRLERGWDKAKLTTDEEREWLSAWPRFGWRFDDCKARHFPGLNDLNSATIDTKPKLWAHIRHHLIPVAKHIHRINPEPMGRRPETCDKFVQEVYSLMHEHQIPGAPEPPYPPLTQQEARDALTLIANRLEAEDARQFERLVETAKDWTMHSLPSGSSMPQTPSGPPSGTTASPLPSQSGRGEGVGPILQSSDALTREAIDAARQNLRAGNQRTPSDRDIRELRDAVRLWFRDPLPQELPTDDASVIAFRRNTLVNYGIEIADCTKLEEFGTKVADYADSQGVDAGPLREFLRSWLANDAGAALLQVLEAVKQHNAVRFKTADEIAGTLKAALVGVKALCDLAVSARGADASAEARLRECARDCDQSLMQALNALFAGDGLPLSEWTALDTWTALGEIREMRRRAADNTTLWFTIWTRFRKELQGWLGRNDIEHFGAEVRANLSHLRGESDPVPTIPVQPKCGVSTAGNGIPEKDANAQRSLNPTVIPQTGRGEKDGQEAKAANESNYLGAISAPTIQALDCKNMVESSADDELRRLNKAAEDQAKQRDSRNSQIGCCREAVRTFVDDIRGAWRDADSAQRRGTGYDLERFIPFLDASFRRVLDQLRTSGLSDSLDKIDLDNLDLNRALASHFHPLLPENQALLAVPQAAQLLRDAISERRSPAEVLRKVADLEVRPIGTCFFLLLQLIVGPNPVPYKEATLPLATGRQSQQAGNDEVDSGRWLTVSDAERLSGINKGTISRAADAGELKDNGKKKRKRRIDTVDFVRWQRERAKQGQGTSETPEAVVRLTKKHVSDFKKC